MASYFSPLRRTIRLFHKVAFELLFGTALVNALIIYKLNTGRAVQITEFKESIIKSLTGHKVTNNDQGNGTPASRKVVKHKLVKSDDKLANQRVKRRRCFKCYQTLATENCSAFAKKKAKLVSTYCQHCNGNPYMCLPCFNEFQK